MQKLLIEPHYLGSLEYYSLLLRFDEVVLEVSSHFTKQTYKNRCYFLSAGGEIPLTVPVKYGNRTTFKDVQIDHQQSWLRDHWGGFHSAYGKAPFFEYFHQEFQKIWKKKQRFLLDLNVDFMTLCLKLLQYDIKISFTNKYEKNPLTLFYDAREQILPKKSFKKRNLYIPFPYMQVFGSNFAPNLSIVDLLMCEGNGAADVLRKSTACQGEQL